MIIRYGIVLTSLCFLSTSFASSAPKEIEAHKNALIHTLAFSPDGKILATGAFDDTIKLWDYSSGKELHTLKGHAGPVYCVVFSRDGKTLASASQDKTIRLWNVADGKQTKEIKGHGDTVLSLDFSPDGKTLASCSADKSVRLWNPEDGKEIKNLGSHGSSVYTVTFNKDGKLLASSASDGTIKIWDLAAKKEKSTLAVEKTRIVKDKDKKDKKEVYKATEAILEVLFSPDNSQLISTGFDRMVRVWNLSDGKQAKEWGPIASDPYGLVLSADGSKLAVCCYGGHLYLFERETGKDLFKTHLKGNITYCLAFSPDGQSLVTGHEKGKVIVTPIK